MTECRVEGNAAPADPNRSKAMRRYHSLRDHVNFLLHRHLAARDLESGAAGIGAMLPDLWRMADRRVRASAAVSPADTDGPRGHVLAGINHHIQVDRWFHGDEVFVEGERLTLASFRNAGVKAPKLGLFAHVTWEMALDGALLRREGLDRTLAILRNDLAGVGGEPLSAAASAHHFDRIERSPQVFRETALPKYLRAAAKGHWARGHGELAAGKCGPCARIAGLEVVLDSRGRGRVAGR